MRVTTRLWNKDIYLRLYCIAVSTMMGCCPCPKVMRPNWTTFLLREIISSEFPKVLLGMDLEGKDCTFV